MSTPYFNSPKSNRKPSCFWNIPTFEKEVYFHCYNFIFIVTTMYYHCIFMYDYPD